MSRSTLFPLAIVVLGSIATTSTAQRPPTLATMNGGCSTLMAAGRDLSAGCNGRLLNTAYASGDSSFMFFVGDGGVVSFYGRDHHAQGDASYIQLARVTFTTPGANPDGGTPPSVLIATGRCTYTNPYRGVSRVTCVATTREGRFAATFVSDGRPPVIG